MKTVLSALAALVLAGTGCKDNDTRYDNDQPVAPKPVETTNDVDRDDLDRAGERVDRNTQGFQDDLSRVGEKIDRNTQGIQSDAKRAGEKIEQGAKRAGQEIKEGWNNATNRVDRDVDVDVKTGRDVDRD